MNLLTVTGLFSTILGFTAGVIWEQMRWDHDDDELELDLYDQEQEEFAWPSAS